MKKAHKLRVVALVTLLMTIPVCTIAKAQNPGNQAALKWSIKAVDSTGGLDTSLVLDASGNPHISYIADNILKYAEGKPALPPTLSPELTATPTPTPTATFTPATTPTPTTVLSPTTTPTLTPTSSPSPTPTPSPAAPTLPPTSNSPPTPTQEPTAEPTATPTTTSTTEPTSPPITQPTTSPSESPSPTASPTAEFLPQTRLVLIVALSAFLITVAAGIAILEHKTKLRAIASFHL